MLNQTLNTQVGTFTPYEQWFNQKPLVHYFCIFGSAAYIFINSKLRTKLDSKSIFAYFVGYSLTSKDYRFWSLLTNKIFEGSDYHINEFLGPYHLKYPPDPDLSNSYVEDTIDSSPPIIQNVSLTPEYSTTNDFPQPLFDTIRSSPLTNDPFPNRQYSSTSLNDYLVNNFPIHSASLQLSMGVLSMGEPSSQIVFSLDTLLHSSKHSLIRQRTSHK